MDLGYGMTPRSINKFSIPNAIQIAEGLHEACPHDIIHSNIMSENIFVNPKNQIKVMDYGLAKLRNSPKLTHAPSTIDFLPSHSNVSCQ